MESSKAIGRPIYRRKRFWALLFLLLIAALLMSCANTRMIMMTAPNTPKGPAASPPITAPNLSAWGAQRADIQRRLEREIYGSMPRNFTSEEVSRRFVSDEDFGGTATIEEVRIKGVHAVNVSILGADGITRSQRDEDRVVEFNMVLLMPKDASSPTPVIMMENFCPNHSVIPVEGITRPSGNYYNCDGEGLMADVFGYFFGRYIKTPPVQMIMERGYALAVIYPHETYPDSASYTQNYRRLSPDMNAQWGAVAAWAYQFSLVANVLRQDESFSELIAFGHSRFGKSALLAAAFDPAIDGVIAHQSGTGGASLSRGKPGETVEDITAGYPHWFTPGFNEDSLTIDQHHLLALVAPRPILLGNAKRDVWSDPNGAYRAAQGADAVYELYGGDGLDQTRLNKMNPEADIAVWMRPGTHGVVEEDWPAFLKFLDAHFK